MSPNSFRPATTSPSRSSRFWLILEAQLLLVLLTTPQFLFAVQPSLLRRDPIAAAQQHIKVTANLIPATLGVAYNAVISVSGGVAPYTFHEHNLPSGLVLNQLTGGISGIPQGSGQFAFDVWVVDAAGTQGLAGFTLTVNQASVGITITPTSATVDSGKTQQFQAPVTNASNAAVTWTASKGSMSASGLFTAPTVSANTPVVVTATSVADPTKSASANISVAAPVVSMVSLEVLFAPMYPAQPYYKDVQTYLVHNPVVSGVNLIVPWSDVDQGPGVNPQYDWSSFDNAMQPWVAAGKKVNLIVWTISDGTTNTAMPQYVWTNLGAGNVATCDGQQIPNYFSPAFQLPYQAFMAAVIQHYGSNPAIGYVRFGLGRGGETNPARGLGTELACTYTLETMWGWTETGWINYLNSMLNYEASLRSPKRLMVGIVGTNIIPNVPSAVAATAVPAHIGFGSQGLEAKDITGYPNCTSDWCNRVNRYAGMVPLELQTVAQSDPSGVGLTGSLATLVPFAVSHHASVLEIYYQDWLLAFDPSYPGYSQYGAVYSNVLTQAAKTPVQ